MVTREVVMLEIVHIEGACMSWFGSQYDACGGWLMPRRDKRGESRLSI
jgi:hypothetical protein